MIPVGPTWLSNASSMTLTPSCVTLLRMQADSAGREYNGPSPFSPVLRAPFFSGVPFSTGPPLFA